MTTSTTTPTANPTTTPASVVATDRPLSIISLVIGLSSIVFGQTFFLPIAGVVLGFLGYRGEPRGRAFAVWGIVLGFVAIFGWIIAAVIGFAVVAPFFWLAVS
jgi:hypothetical protein